MFTRSSTQQVSSGTGWVLEEIRLLIEVLAVTILLLAYAEIRKNGGPGAPPH